MDDDFFQNSFARVNDIFIRPEVERRLAAGMIDRSWRMYAAQVLMNVGEDPRVLLNDEIHGVFGAVLKDRDAIVVGGPLDLSRIESIESVTLTQNDPNAAHVTFVAVNGTWFGTFDLRYNRGRILEVLAVADDFLATAADALNKSRQRPFVENLFAAVELSARCSLMMQPDEAYIRPGGTHKLIKTRFNLSAAYGNIDHDYSSLLNRLQALRNPARYMERDFWLEPWTADEMLATGRRFRRDVEDRLPQRHSPRAFIL